MMVTWKEVDAGRMDGWRRQSFRQKREHKWADVYKESPDNTQARTQPIPLEFLKELAPTTGKRPTFN